MVSAFVREYHLDYTRRARELGERDNGLRVAIAECQLRIDRLVAAIAEGGDAFAEIRAALAAATAERESLQADLDDLVSLPVVALHPQIAEQYRTMVRDLAAAMEFPEAQKTATPELRPLLDTIVITPSKTDRKNTRLNSSP